MDRILKVIVVNLLILAVFLFAFEVGLRKLWHMSALKGEIYQASQNHALRYELKPGIRTEYACHPLSVNSDGFRGREHSLRKDPGTYRIVLIGDSVAFGKLLAFEDTFGERLREGMAAACPAKKIEVLNMGIEGYNSFQELEMLKVKGLKYGPDLVIVYYCFNDPEDPEYYFRKNFLSRHSQLARYVAYKAKKYRIKKEKKKLGIKSIEDNFRYLYSSPAWQHTKEAIGEMGDLAAAKGIKMVLLITPEMSEPVKDFRQGYPFWYINDLIAAIKHDNIVIVDPVREFSRLGLEKNSLAVWSYPGRRANEIIAEYTIGKLRENKIDFCN